MTQYWYAVHSKPRKEQFLAQQMELRKIEIFNPQIRVQRANPRAKKIVPYFPGYIFIHIDPLKLDGFSIQYVPGGTGLVTFGGEPARVPDGLIHAIRLRVDEINSAGGELFDAIHSGDEVLIHSGPFAGYEAIFDMRLPGSDRVRVLLSLLRNQRMPVDLPAGQIRPKK